MQVKSSSGGGGVSSELKDLLELVSKPDKLKHALADLEEQTKTANDAVKALKHKEAELNALKNEAEEKLSIAGELYDKAKVKEDECKAKQAAINAQEAKLHFQEKQLQEQAASFKAHYEEASADLLIKQGAAENQLKIAKQASEAADALVKEYQAKVNKLQAAMH